MKKKETFYCKQKLVVYNLNIYFDLDLKFVYSTKSLNHLRIK